MAKDGDTSRLTSMAEMLTQIPMEAQTAQKVFSKLRTWE